MGLSLTRAISFNEARTTLKSYLLLWVLYTYNSNYQLKLIKMRAKFANLNECAVPFYTALPPVWAGSGSWYYDAINIMHDAYY